ncbi:MAG: (d)CMP kinase, partial [Lachnospiraceae bacterium]|nr:(d)CMP kinase [Lachnospiraceae bacterium]
ILHNVFRPAPCCRLSDTLSPAHGAADSRVRAERRYEELADKGIPSDLDTIEKDIIERDHQDMTRELSPLRQAEDATLIDSSYMTIDEVVEAVIAMV